MCAGVEENEGELVGVRALLGRLNRAIGRMSGYQLTRTGSAAVSAGDKHPSSARSGGVQSGTTRVLPPGQQRRQTETLPKDYDQQTREIWRAVRDRTMTRHTSVHFLVQAVRYVERNHIPGAIVECGVWRGGSMLAVAHTPLGLGVIDRDLYLFDTFQGMTPPTDRDVRMGQGKHAKEFLSGTGSAPMAWARPGNFVADLDDVTEGFAPLGCPQQRTHFVPGAVEATDEVLRQTGEPLLLTRVARGAVAVKPGLKSTF